MTDDLRARVAELPLDRRIELLSGRDFWSTEPIDELGLPSVVLTDGPHGVRRQPADADHLGFGASVPATCFPTASALGATWDVELLAEVGAAIGREARHLGVGVVLGPGLNLKRHPLGGRNFEYLSEDPLLSGRLAGALTRGIQSEGVGACLKHFVANNHETYRMVVDCVVDERTLRELYLRGFEIAVAEGRPWAVMTAYNQVNGTYCSDSERLLRDVLRGEWGFDGVVVTDWGGMNDRVAAVHAGVDLEMPSSGGAFDGEVRRAVGEGRLDPELVTDRAVAVARLAARVAAAPPPGAVDEVDHHRLARRVAAAATVLLANDGVLPLDPACDVAVIGAFAERPRYQGAGSSHVTPTRLDDARRHLEERLTGHVRYAPGYDPVTGETDGARIRAAVEVAREADVAVVLVGLPPLHEAEGIDRTTLALPAGHDELVDAVAAANPRTVVVLCNGAPVLVPWADRVAAVVEAHLGGQAGGGAIVDVLVGDAEPGGRLAETFPASRFVPADEHFAGRGRQVQYREGPFVGYRYHDSAGVAPRFPFGHGRSYTEFELADLHLERTDDGPVRLEVTVRNVGGRPGSEVVQVYVHVPSRVVDRPDQELAGFAKVHLDPATEERVHLELDRRSFAWFDVEDHRWHVEPGTAEIRVGVSSADIRLRATVELEGDPGTPRARPRFGADRFVADDDTFAALLGHPVPDPTPVLPFHRNTLVCELDRTRLGRRVQATFRRVGERRLRKLLGPDPDPVLRRIGEVMLEEAPLRFLATMSSSSPKVFDGLTTALSALRLTGRRGVE